MNWTELLGNVASGGLLGLLGSTVGEVTAYFRRKQEHAQKIESLKLEGELRAAQTAGDLAIAREKGAADAFTASQQAERDLKGEHRWVTSFRAFTRPGLTWTALLAAIIYGFFPPESEVGIAIVRTLNVYAGMMVAWWFGQRQMDRTTTSWGSGSINGRVGTSAG